MGENRYERERSSQLSSRDGRERESDGKYREELRAMAKRARLDREIEAMEAELRRLSEQLNEKRRERASIDTEENEARLGKLPQEVWDKVFDELDRNDLFPLASSCKYFRHKQKELLARKRWEWMRMVTGWSGEEVCDLPHQSQAYLKWLFRCSEMLGEKQHQENKIFLTAAAAHHGYLPLVKLFGSEEGRGGEDGFQGVFWCCFDEGTCKIAAYSGHVHVIKCLIEEEGVEWTEDIAKTAAHTGQIKVLQYVLDNNLEWDPDKCVCIAEENGKHEVVEWIAENAAEYF